MDIFYRFYVFFWLMNLIQNDYLNKSVHKWTYPGRKYNKLSQSLPVHAARGFKLKQHNNQYM